MFTYYKGWDKALVWRAVPATSRKEIEVAEGTFFTTILDVSENVRSSAKGGSISDAALYQGPFYVDIDSDNIEESIAALKKVIKKFGDFKVPAGCLNIWLSGKRGFHLTLDFSSFTDGKPLTKLPWCYKQLAMSMGLFEVLCVDKTVYSGGRGRMWRVENKKRQDNGNYKVRLTSSEALEITPDKHNKLAKAPRHLEMVPVKLLPAFAKVFELARAKALAVQKPKAIFVDRTLLEHLKGELPPCAADLLAWRNIKTEVGFNDISLQFGKAAAGFSGYNGELHLKEFSANAKGTSYDTAAKRLTHCKTAYTVARASSQYEFSCHSMLSVLNDEPCMECPIAFIRLSDEDRAVQHEIETKIQEAQGVTLEPIAPPLAKAPASLLPKQLKQPKPERELEPVKIEEEYEDEDEYEFLDEPVNENLGQAFDNVMEAKPQKDIFVNNSMAIYGQKRELEAPGPIPNNRHNIIETEEGYAIVEGRGIKPISNFVIRLKNTFFEHIPSKGIDKRVSVEGQVYVPGATEKDLKPMGVFEIEDSNWARSGMINSLSGLGNAAFFGDDNHMQKLKAVLMENAEKVTNSIKKVFSHGIHRQEVNGQFVFTYVEPGWSIDQFNNQNTYSFSGQSNVYPQLKNVPLMRRKCPTTSKTLKSLFAINDAQRIGLIIGWTMACFLKEHIFTFKPEFPLLSLHGEPGSGKTSTARIIGSLHGVDYSTEFSPVNLAGSTPFAVWNFIAESKTGPRLVEEFNKSKLDKPGSYNGYIETFKATYNNHAHSQGYITNGKNHGTNQRGTAVMSIPMTGPTVLCSEQSIADVALVERCLQVRFTSNRTGKEMLAFKAVTPFLKDLKGFAKVAYGEALATSVKEVEDRLTSMSDKVSSQIEKTRPRHCFETMFLGLDFLRRIIDKYELDCVEEFDQMHLELSNWISKNEKTINKSKAISEVDIIMTTLNSISASPTGEERWKISQVYSLRGNILYLDLLSAHQLYVNYIMTTGRSTPAIERITEFVSLLEGEQYCMKTGRDPVRQSIAGLGRGRPAYCLDTNLMQIKGLDVSGFLEELDT